MIEFLLAIGWKSLAILGLTLAALSLLRRHSAARRAVVAHMGLVATLLLPVAAISLPRWEVAAIPTAEFSVPVSAASPSGALLAAPSIMTVDVRSGESRPLSSRQQYSSVAAIIGAGPSVAAGIFYGIPAIVLLAKILVSFAELFALRRRAVRLDDPFWERALANARRRMNVGTAPGLYACGEISSPVSWGVLHPVILVPAQSAIPPASAEAIMIHELAHLVRKDWISLLLARLATAILWFNPLVWILANRAHQLREEAADDVVLRHDVNSLQYAELLVGLACNEEYRPLLAANTAASGTRSLARRIARVLDGETRRGPAHFAWVIAFILVASAAVIPLGAFSARKVAPRPLVVTKSRTSAAASVPSLHSAYDPPLRQLASGASASSSGRFEARGAISIARLRSVARDRPLMDPVAEAAQNSLATGTVNGAPSETMGSDNAPLQASYPAGATVFSGDKTKMNYAAVDKESMNLVVTDSSFVRGTGRVARLTLRVDKAGRVDFSNLAARHVTIIVSDGGEAIIAPHEDVDVTVTGSGIVRFVTKPSRIQRQVRGLGSLIELP